MAPKAFLFEWGYDFQRSEELDTLTREEELLIEAYEAKKRPDLAECVRSGPKYRLVEIDQPIGFNFIQGVIRFRRTFGRGQKDLTYPKTMNEWVAECLEIFKDDPGLEMFSAEDRMPQPEPHKPGMPVPPPNISAEVRAGLAARAKARGDPPSQ
jgi:hypothetical protein